MTAKIHPSWATVLDSEFSADYFRDIRQFLQTEIEQKKSIYPYPKHILSAFDFCPFDAVKVVILGQDPYHSHEILDGKISPHAHGLSFSIPSENKKVPPSLQNIYKELRDDLGAENFSIPTHGNLSHWAHQGVLLLNASLTVEAHTPNSHASIGWHRFTDAVIQKISAEKTGVVFLLWGNFARSKKALIDTEKHLVLEAPHPSPFSAHSGFFGCRHFSSTNEYLVQNGQKPIKWGVRVASL